MLMFICTLICPKGFQGTVPCFFLDYLLWYTLVILLSCTCCPKTVIGNVPFNTDTFSSFFCSESLPTGTDAYQGDEGSAGTCDKGRR